MAEVQLYFIGTSKSTEIRMSGAVTYNWGSYSKWKKFKEPKAQSSKKVAYSKKRKDKPGSSKYGGLGADKEVCGTKIPSTATKIIGGVEATVAVRYYVRGKTVYKRTSALKNKKKMLKYTYTKAKPYEYKLQYKDKPTYESDYSQWIDGVQYVYFADHYYDDNGNRVDTAGHLPHPSGISFSYSDVRKNLESTANNSEQRDNKGMYVMSNIRANIMTLQLTWTGLAGDEGRDLLAILNPDTGKNYLTVQYLDPEIREHKNGTFFAAERNVIKYPNGLFKEITVTLTEV